MKSRSKNKVENTIAIFDIDGTLRRTTDPWMLLHKHLGTAEEGEKYYKAWISKEISYSKMTELDASLFKGKAKNEMLKILDLNPIRKGSDNLINWFKSQKIPCVGISTGLSFLNDITAKKLGLDEVISNEVLFENGICSGEVKINVEEHTKNRILERVLEKYNIHSGTVISFGDGPADISMFNLSTISFAVFPKSKEVSSSADFTIDTEPIDKAIDYLPELTL
jgi:phosphoserine phosphatase